MVQIPGLTAGQYYQPGAVSGYSMNVPRDWSQGGKQYYDPQYAIQLPQQQPSQASYANQQLGGSNMGRYNQFAPKPTTPKPAGGGSGSSLGNRIASSFGNGFGSSSFGSGGWGASGQINTSIQPQPIYEPWMTTHAVSQLQADQLRGADPFYAQKAFDRPGVSRSAGTLAAAMPEIAQRRAAVRQIGAGVPMNDALANAGNVIGGQIEREQEALGYGSLYARMLSGQLGFDRAQAGQSNQNIGTIGSLLSAIYGG